MRELSLTCKVSDENLSWQSLHQTEYLNIQTPARIERRTEKYSHIQVHLKSNVKYSEILHIFCVYCILVGIIGLEESH